MLEIIELIGQGIDVTGVVVMVSGIIISTVYFLNSRQRGQDPAEAYQNYRHGVGRAILLGLEILIVADIIRTIAIEPTFASLGILAVIVLIRTFLSATLELELEGRWPWQQPTVETEERRRQTAKFVAVNER
ncbi:MAG: DUF1622 domain-containing protein [Anaerolineae bacterium]|nr:DUF1622 domain-containing protein [Anaerolineae bacterium]MCB9109131.1 DUF1622 domain-containing protein [Anaerolineales bacterium]